MDEAGRGCLAGPVYAGAVILQSEIGLDRFRDSKQISEKVREELFDLILANHRVGIGFASVSEIDKLNILNATFLAMRRAIASLELTEIESSKVHIWVDGNQLIRELDLPQTPVVKGDHKLKAIGAASIVAKVTRDREMYRLAKLFPQYGYEVHKGYGTKFHRETIATFGPTENHRATFAGVKEFVGAGPRGRENRPGLL